MIRRFLLVLLVVSILVIGLAVPVYAEEEGITCTVTPLHISVELSDSTVSYGVVDLSSHATSQVITVTNNGTVSVNLDIKGAAATGGGEDTWTLSDTATGNNQYMHEFAIPNPTYPAEGGHTDWTALTTSYQDLVNNIGMSGTQSFKMQIWTPTATGTYGERSTTVTILATEATP